MILIGRSACLTRTWNRKYAGTDGRTVEIHRPPSCRRCCGSTVLDIIGKGGIVMKLMNRVVWLTVVLAVAPPVASGATIEYENGSRYEGDVDDDGRPHGWGTMYRDDDSINREGEWRSGEPHGWGREYYRNDNPSYEGESRNGERHGLGRRYNRDGCIRYEGQWLDGERHGLGTEYHRNDCDKPKYKGQWRRDERHGFGTEYYRDGGGKKYEGQWRRGERHG